jgi:hypothetical protein
MSSSNFGSFILIRDWWYADGALLSAEDTSHEEIVLEHVVSMLCDVMGITNNIFECDCTAFRAHIEQHYGPHALALAAQKLVEHGTTQEEAQHMVALAAGLKSLDPRYFAIKRWGWVRVASTTFECRDLSIESLKLVREVLEEILEAIGEDPDELLDFQVRISDLKGNSEWASLAQLHELETGREDDLNQTAAQIARNQLRQMDLALMPACYRGVIGD